LCLICNENSGYALIMNVVILLRIVGLCVMLKYYGKLYK
jgi:hypothetical protein